MTDIQTIQEEIMAVYAAISLPVLGVPSTQKQEPDGGFDSGDLPAVVVTRGILTSSEDLAVDRKRQTREYIVDLFCYVFDDDDPVNATSRNNTADCINSVHAAFDLHGLDTSGVISHRLTADTDDVQLMSRDNTTNYIGVRFRHEVVYWQLT